MLRTLPASVLLACLAYAQPSDPEPILRQAIAMHQAGDMEGAIRHYREYLQQRPNSIEARSNLGAALAKTGRFEEAIEQYNRALETKSSNPQVLLNLSLAYYK